MCISTAYERKEDCRQFLITAMSVQHDVNLMFQKKNVCKTGGRGRFNVEWVAGCLGITCLSVQLFSIIYLMFNVDFWNRPQHLLLGKTSAIWTILETITPIHQTDRRMWASEGYISSESWTEKSDQHFLEAISPFLSLCIDFGMFSVLTFPFEVVFLQFPSTLPIPMPMLVHVRCGILVRRMWLGLHALLNDSIILLSIEWIAVCGMARVR